MSEIMKLETKNKPLLIAYSRLEEIELPQNSAEFFKAACKASFDGIKGDVAVTKDKKLIMCHDDGFLFDENGRFYPPTTYEEECRAELIEKFTFEECINIEFNMPAAFESLGYYAKITDLETFIKICAENGKIAYITLRDKEIDVLVNETYELLKKYNMVERCIINSFSLDTLAAMRKLDKNIPLSNVFGPNIPITKERVDNIIPLGNCILCAFWAIEEVCGDRFYEQSHDAMIYANAKGIELHLAHAFDKETLEKAKANGFTGFQCFSTKVL